MSPAPVNDAVPPLDLRSARRFLDRLRGLLGHGALTAQAGLWLSPCNAVHTFGLAYAIDVVFLDDRYCVLKRVDCLRPNRVAICLRARSVVELPAGYCRDHARYRVAIRRALCRTGRCSYADPSRGKPPRSVGESAVSRGSGNWRRIR